MRRLPVQLAAGWRFRAQRPDPAVLAWLKDPGSLTARLLVASGGDFHVRLVRLVRERPTRAEARELGLHAGESALVREVVLVGRGEDWVVARSVIPRRTLTGRNRRLASLGERPLGAFLFRDPTLERRAVRVVALPALAPGAAVRAWGRRSMFVLHGQPLLVAEYFLPALLGGRTA